MSNEKSADRRKYHVIYRTTCKVTGRYYIGMHSTDKLDDGYMGSGKRLWRSLKKHGRENHVYEIIEHLLTRQALRKREAELVNAELLEDKMCMNLTLGGGGGWEAINANYTSEQRLHAGRLGGFSNKHLWSTETLSKWHTSVTEHNRARWNQFLQDHPDEVGRRRANGLKAAQSTEAREKRKLSFEKIGHQTGEKNSQFGTRWVHNSTGCKKIKSTQLEEYLMRGFKLGKKNTPC